MEETDRESQLILCRQVHQSTLLEAGLQPTDWELVQKARAGDSSAFDALIQRHLSSLYGTAVMMIGNAQDAQDITQETLLAVFQGLPRFEARSSFKTWATSILIRKVGMHIRGRQGLRLSLDGPDAPAVADVRSDEGQRASDARHDVQILLSRLNPEHRQVLVLREIQGFSYDEIAEALGIPRGTVESRLARARAALRDAAMTDQRGNTNNAQPGKGVQP